MGKQRIAALRPKVHIGLVNHHQAVPVGIQNPLDFPGGEGKACGGVGVGDDDKAILVVVVPGIQGEILV